MQRLIEFAVVWPRSFSPLIEPACRSSVRQLQVFMVSFRRWWPQQTRRWSVAWAGWRKSGFRIRNINHFFGRMTPKNKTFKPGEDPSIHVLDARQNSARAVCGEKTRASVVYCRSCRTLHHYDCWKYIGHCSVYGCGEKKCFILKPRNPKTAHDQPARKVNPNQANRP